MAASMPASIAQSLHAADCWARITKGSASWPTSGTDVNLAVRYCMMWASFMATQESIERYGMIVPIIDKDGAKIGYKDRPEIERASKISAELTKLEEQIERQKHVSRKPTPQWSDSPGRR